MLMRIDSLSKKGFIYLTLIAIAVIASLIYGNMLDANIGSFKQYMYFGDNLPLWAIILIPICITALYVYIVLIAYRNGLLKMSKGHIAFIVLLCLMFVYMTIIISTKDLTHALGNYLPNDISTYPTINEKIWSILSFYLSLTTIYAYFELVKPVKGFKGFFTFILVLIALYALSSIIYSLATEWDKYVNFAGFEDMYDKPYSEIIKSFYGIGNVYGHTVYYGMLALIIIGFLYRKYWTIAISLLYVPFIFYSNCRAAMLSTFALFVGLLLYFWIRCYSYSKKWFIVFTVFVLAIAIILIVDLTCYSFIKFTLSNGNEISLKGLINEIIDNYVNNRLNIIQMTNNKMNFTDYLLGFGYGLAFIVPRTYNDFLYYYHNSFYEILMQGGAIYCAFISGIYLYVLYKVLRASYKTDNYRLLGFMIVISLSQLFYGQFESTPILFNDFYGGVLGVYLILLPKVYSDFDTRSENYLITNSFQEFTQV